MGRSKQTGWRKPDAKPLVFITYIIYYIYYDVIRERTSSQLYRGCNFLAWHAHHSRRFFKYFVKEQL